MALEDARPVDYLQVLPGEHAAQFQRAGFAVKHGPSTSSLSLTGTPTVVPGTPVSIVVSSPDSVVIAVMHAKLEALDSRAANGVHAEIYRGGVGLGAHARGNVYVDLAAPVTATVSATVVETGLAAGTHTYDIRATRTGAGATANGLTATMTVLLIDR